MQKKTVLQSQIRRPSQHVLHHIPLYLSRASAIPSHPTTEAAAVHSIRTPPHRTTSFGSTFNVGRLHQRGATVSLFVETSLIPLPSGDDTMKGFCFNPKNAIFHAKRPIGRCIDDYNVKKDMETGHSRSLKRTTNPPSPSNTRASTTTL